MTNQKLNELALQAWKDGIGDAMTAVKLLRERSGISLREAHEHIQKTAHRVGGRYGLRLLTGPKIAEALARDEIRDENTHAARGAMLGKPRTLSLSRELLGVFFLFGLTGRYAICRLIECVRPFFCGNEDRFARFRFKRS